MKDVKTLSGAETVETLRMCGDSKGSCAECPLFDEKRNNYPVRCYNDLMLHAANLIEWMMEEIEKVRD